MTFKKGCLLTLATLLLLSACGKRGNLEYPDNARPDRPYPAPVNPAPRPETPPSARTLPTPSDAQDPMLTNPAMEMNVLQGLDMPNVPQEVTAPDYRF